MTPQIQNWMEHYARPFISRPGRVLEVGSRDINGSVRQFFYDAEVYIGTDQEPGVGVDCVVNNKDLYNKFGKDAPCFDTIIACEVFEHDHQFWWTHWQILQLLRPRGYLIVTTPTFGFPLHRYPKDYWRFGEDAYREFFFKDMEILDLRCLDNDAGPQISMVGIARKGAE